MGVLRDTLPDRETPAPVARRQGAPNRGVRAPPNGGPSRVAPAPGAPGSHRQSRGRDHVAVSAFQAEVRAAILGIPPGGVLTYGEIALVAGHPGAARAVGRALAQSSGLPWWR
ncbi:MAG: MGMT family protein, partial [Candidatus Dormibacteria bacterium]